MNTGCDGTNQMIGPPLSYVLYRGAGHAAIARASAESMGRQPSIGHDCRHAEETTTRPASDAAAIMPRSRDGCRWGAAGLAAAFSRGWRTLVRAGAAIIMNVGTLRTDRTASGNVTIAATSNTRSAGSSSDFQRRMAMTATTAARPQKASCCGGQGGGCHSWMALA